MGNQIELIELWDKILEKLRPNVPPIIYSTWFTRLIPLQIIDSTLEVGVQKKFIQEWFEMNHKKTLQDALTSVAPEPLMFKIVNLDIQDTPTDSYEASTNIITESVRVKSNYAKPQNTVLFQDEAPANSASDSKNANSISNTFEEEINNSLNPKYVFDNFVIGGSNQFAHAAALAVAENLGKVYNPLFLYGGVGLGKTHLMHAIGNKIKKVNPHLKILYISSEKFTNELINSIRDGNPEAFRQKYRNIDCLLVDDIQFLSKKEHTQEEFFHTFNTLYEANKHIIISSDRQPKEIPTLEDRLRSRFEWGLITDIQAPDLETRIAILRKKALIEKIDVPNDIILLIASRIDNNIRELEGALIRVMAYSSINKVPITMETAQIALKDVFPEVQKRLVTIERVQEVVASYYKLKLEDFSVKKRTRNIAFPRQVAMYLCREMTGASLPRIGELFGGRDHTTVLHAYEKINKERGEDSKLDQVIKELTAKIHR